jgi:hypothetical protein
MRKSMKEFTRVFNKTMAAPIFAMEREATNNAGRVPFGRFVSAAVKPMHVMRLFIPK